MYAFDIVQKIVQKFSFVSEIPVPEKFVRDPLPQLKVPAAKLVEVCQFLKNDSEMDFDLPNHMTAVDYIKDGLFELVYFVYSTRKKNGLIIKSHVSRQDPEIDSVSSVWSGMDWQEREVFDLFGIVFKGHPYLKRIMLWDGYPGHPLRKDYVHVTDKYDSGLEVGTPGLDEKGLPVAKG